MATERTLWAHCWAGPTVVLALVALLVPLAYVLQRVRAAAGTVPHVSLLAVGGTSDTRVVVCYCRHERRSRRLFGALLKQRLPHLADRFTSIGEVRTRTNTRT